MADQELVPHTLQDLFHSSREYDEQWQLKMLSLKI